MGAFQALLAAGREWGAMLNAAYDQWTGVFNSRRFAWLNPVKPLVGKPTILLHGSFGDPSNWKGFIEAIERANPPNLGGVYLLKFEGVQDGLAKLKALVETLDGEVNLVGHSLGGLVATQYAALHPGKVDKLCLLGTRLKILENVWLDGPRFVYGDVVDTIGQVAKTWNVKEAPHEVHTLIASHDWLVPKEAVDLPGAHPVLINGWSHLGLTQSPVVHQTLIEILWDVNSEGR